LLIYFLPEQSITINLILTIFFILLSLTDFFDGFLARKYNQETLIGSILDPIADKFLLFSTLITLVYLQKIFFYIAIIFIAREFFVMCLRQVALTYNFKLTVIQNAKFKTFFQFAYISFIILNNNKYKAINNLESFLLFISLYLSIISAFNYYLIFIKKYNNINQSNS
jgi:CDP-diacylglycerol--glycerol-3-phosphate 3-phosphatidyltransferase